MANYEGVTGACIIQDTNNFGWCTCSRLSMAGAWTERRMKAVLTNLTRILPKSVPYISSDVIRVCFD